MRNENKPSKREVVRSLAAARFGFLSGPCMFSVLFDTNPLAVGEVGKISSEHLLVA